MGWVAPVLAVAGTALDLVGQEQERGAKAKESADNQALANRAAADAIARGNQDAGRTRMATTQLIARQKVAFAASGVDPTVGTPADVAASTAMFGELKAKTDENNAAREAFGFKTYGLKYQQQAQLDQTRATNQEVGTALGGLGKLASYWPKD
ncbi:MAG: hypothetical protein WC876_01870 [Candidatus Thermoplasmatota archaeon]|jgi:hypothetical protein